MEVQMSDEPKEQSNKVEEKPQSESLTDDKPIENVSDRTKERIEKLSREKKKLLEENERLKKESSVSILDSLRPDPAPQDPQPMRPPPTPDTKPRLFDDKGYLDESLLNKRLDEANKKAEEAKIETLRIQQDALRNEEDRQLRETYKEFPQLNPNGEEYDEKFYNLTRNELIGQMMKGEKNLLEAAKKVEKLYQPEKGSVEVKKTQKEQINSMGTSSRRIESTVDQDDLVQGSIDGDWKSVAERLRRSGHGPSDNK